MALALSASSREALAAAGARLDEVIDSSHTGPVARIGEKVGVTTGPGTLAQLGDELFAFTRLLAEQPAVRRLLGDATAPEASRVQLAERLVGGQLSDTTMDMVRVLVSARWSRSLDLLDAAEALARRATLGPAEKDGSLDDVEDELFRFGRVLDREPQLSTLLSDRATPEQGRIGLLDQVLAGRTSAVATALLQQSVRLPRGRHMDEVAEELADLAAERRERYVARVATAVALTPEQESRLTESLTRLYGRPMSLHVELDEGLLGGLVVRVGGEVIDGSVAGRLAAARRALPS
ncbi:F0F1 ATP synthase subunit delta [Pseudonocardia humida]|uniref:ATP synthase subunit delta n=1 Tax=Pseudonocardia humida TaxID=2800819 RepID=A0ABT1A566_9PSEU|nr:F0F1 ATP synthase subunit delta [Pseudonocardia humida]MCO1658152.1 F0F1 ATP synthase subunit delta [Pseudonocardia humida]